MTVPPPLKHIEEPAKQKENDRMDIRKNDGDVAAVGLTMEALYASLGIVK